MPALKLMVCVGCGATIRATVQQARRHGWHFWVGGARCKACVAAKLEPEKPES